MLHVVICVSIRFLMSTTEIFFLESRHAAWIMNNDIVKSRLRRKIIPRRFSCNSFSSQHDLNTLFPPSIRIYNLKHKILSNG